MFEPKVAKTLALISQLGISMLVPVFLMTWLGSWIDETFSTHLFPLFIILGIGGGFRSVYIVITRVMRDHQKEKKDEQKDDWGD